MRVTNLLENLKFGSKDAHAEPVHAERDGRAIVFTLKPGQSIREHNAPSSPFFVVVLRGRGVFAGGDAVEQTCGPSSLLVFGAGENHTIRALEDLVFVGILHGAPGAQK
jgi:quercetin dioxygenase-like cupin family protein